MLISYRPTICSGFTITAQNATCIHRSDWVKHMAYADEGSGVRKGRGGGGGGGGAGRATVSPLLKRGGGGMNTKPTLLFAQSGGAYSTPLAGWAGGVRSGTPLPHPSYDDHLSWPPPLPPPPPPPPPHTHTHTHF